MSCISSHGHWQSGRLKASCAGPGGCRANPKTALQQQGTHRQVVDLPYRQVVDLPCTHAQQLLSALRVTCAGPGHVPGISRLLDTRCSIAEHVLVHALVITVAMAARPHPNIQGLPFLHTTAAAEAATGHGMAAGACQMNTNTHSGVLGLPFTTRSRA